MSVPPPHRLGVHLVDDGIEVAVLAPHADAIDLCLLDPAPAGGWRERRIRLPGPDLGVFSARVPGIGPGQHYGLRAHGPWDPRNGLRYNPAKLLIDPYAVGLSGELRYGPRTYGHQVNDDLSGDPYGPADDRDSAAHVPHSVVLDLNQDPALDPAHNRPYVPWSDTVIYEAHVRSLSARHPGIPADQRGTYAALGHPVLIEHLLRLGVTAVELLPIHACTPEPQLIARGMTNYWGYNTLCFFAPDPRWASAAARAAGPGAVLAELRTAVRRLHTAGIEVLLDVVYNHTSEGGLGGQHLSLRGLDASVYYRHDSDDPARLSDVTGCGNTLDFTRAEVVRLAMDSLRFWVQQVGIDGFRFDLAVALARGAAGFDPRHPFLVATAVDPALQDVKLIAEPWDVGPDGWRTGQFPPPWSEWNDAFRDSVRSFWLADPARATHGDDGYRVRDLATRLSGSADLFGPGDPPLRRGTRASLNYVTAHDGFTLADLVAYEHKHNEANGEQNRDGTDDNRSWNHGAEGPLQATAIATDILPIRRRSMRNLLGTLLLSAGVPMLTAGDEVGRTQRGNNNAYCQDQLTWQPWALAPWRRDLLATVRHLTALRRAHPALRGGHFYTGGPAEHPDLAWFDSLGLPLTHDRWHDGDLRTLQMLRQHVDDAALIVLNGSLEPQWVTLPAEQWRLTWDSVWERPSDARTAAIEGDLSANGPVLVEPLSLRLYLR